MTGKNEWRLIHVGPGGVFTDSLVYNKKKGSGDAAAAPQNFITEGSAGRREPDGPLDAGCQHRRQGCGPATCLALRAIRIILRLAVPPLQPGVVPAWHGPQPGFQQPVSIRPACLSSTPIGQLIPNTGIGVNGINPQTGFPGQMPQIPPQPGFGLPPGAPPPGSFPMTGQNGQTPNPAPAGAGLIGQLLTTPTARRIEPDSSGNRATAAANTGGTAPAAATGQTIGGGIAGVASKREQEGIKSLQGQAQSTTSGNSCTTSRRIPPRRRRSGHRQGQRRQAAPSGQQPQHAAILQFSSPHLSNQHAAASAADRRTRHALTVSAGKKLSAFSPCLTIRVRRQGPCSSASANRTECCTITSSGDLDSSASKRRLILPFLRIGRIDETRRPHRCSPDRAPPIPESPAPARRSQRREIALDQIRGVAVLLDEDRMPRAPAQRFDPHRARAGIRIDETPRLRSTLPGC